MQSTQFTPTSLDDFVFGNRAARERLEDIVNGYSDFPNEKRALLLFGNAGTGKSELAKFIPSLLEASPHVGTTANAGGIFGSGFTDLTPCRRGMKASHIIDPLITRSLQGVYSPKGLRYEIFDEVDELAPEVINTLKGVMTQKETRYVVFIFTTNNQAKLEEPMTSRCISIPMWRAKPDQLVPVGQAAVRRIGFEGDLLPESVLQDLASRHGCDLRGFLSEVRTLARKSYAQGAATP